jgi:Neocarzinostatin family
MVGVLRRLGVLLVAATVMVLFGAAPAWAAPTVSASPSTDLVHGQTVTVSGSGYSAGTSLAVLQCVAGGTNVFDFCDIGGFVSVTTDSNGAFSTSFTVLRVFDTSQGETDCAAAPGTCLIAVSPFATTYVASTPLSFDPNGPLPVTLQITVEGLSAAVRDNEVLLQGTVTCTAPADVFIEGRLRQVVQRFFINASFSTSVECDGETPFAVVFEGENGVIKKGDAQLELTASGFSVDDDDQFTLDTTIRVRSK